MLGAYEERMTEERARLEQKEAALKRKEKDIDANIQEKEVESRERMEAERRKATKKLKEYEDALKAERRDWEEEKERVKQTRVFEKVVTLDVGGTKYRTTLSTLTKYPDSMLGAMFSGRHNLPQQEDGSYFIDRDGEAFKYVLMYLRDRDRCSDVFYDEDFHNPNGRSSTPSLMERQMLRSIALEAKYFQLGELETTVLIILNAGRRDLHGGIGIPKNQYAKHWATAGAQPFGAPVHHRRTVEPKCYPLDYGRHTLQCHQYSDGELKYAHRCISMNCKHSAAHTFSEQMQGTDFTKNITFDSCDLSGVTFHNCYFQEGVSFEGCILRGTKFERVGGLVRHKVHFAPWQVAQADFEPELLQALKDNGCIY